MKECVKKKKNRLPSSVRLIVLTSHTLLSPQSCHAYPAPLSQRNITVSYNWGQRRGGGGGGQSSNFLKVDWQTKLCEVCATIKTKKINK